MLNTLCVTSLRVVVLVCWTVCAYANPSSGVAGKALSLIENNCKICHGPQGQSGLDLSERTSALKGGKRGPAVIPGDADNSLLYRVMAHETEPHMPPGSRNPYPKPQLAIIRQWITEGAEWTAVPEADSGLAVQANAFLAKNCYACHGKAQMSGLDLRERESALKGGKRGPAIIAGNAEKSLLYAAIAHRGDLKMPAGSKTPASTVDLAMMRNWINEGAPWIAPPSVTKRQEPDWWAFRRPIRATVPQPGPNLAQAENPVDSFILSKLREKGLTPAPPADKLTLVRRVYLDLTGLPPSADEVDKFIKDGSPDAYERLVNQLLDSPRYGERWARYWLDVVRYADSGGFETDIYYPDAWRYRDYVIKSFNDDKPFDRFVQEQIAGDELWPDNLDMKGTYAVPLEKLEHLEARIGTGLYTFGPLIGESAMDASRLSYERLTDWADTTGAAFLGLTVGCARCHDHKFDPISQKDYSRMQAIFASSQPTQVPVVPPTSISNRMEGWLRVYGLVERRNAYKLAVERVRQRITEQIKATFPPETVRAYETPDEKRTPDQRLAAMPLDEAIKALKIEDQLSAAEKQELRKLRESVAESAISFPESDASHGIRYDGFFDVPMATVLSNVDPEVAAEVHTLDRGDLGKNKDRVGPGLPAILSEGDEFNGDASGAPRHRKRLALWLTRPDHPLTSRVIVNRIWQWHFGSGIVSSSNDFGRQGQAPTHPELLDWLATEFVAQGWSIKSLHRLIMNSEVYRMSSRFSNDTNLRLDPDNALVWRANRRRLEAEALWDSIHAVAGTINFKMGGRPVMPPLSGSELTALRNKDQWAAAADPSEHQRRAIYIMSRRTFGFPMLEQFDRPDPGVSCARRDVTTVAPQSLWLLNNQVPFEQSIQLAGRLVQEENGAAGRTEWITALWRRALGRTPRQDEVDNAKRLMDSLAARGAWANPPHEIPTALTKIDPSEAAALAELCLAVFNLSEFAYID